MSKAPPQVVDSAGRAVPLGARMGQGGEGAVYEVSGRKDTVAKVYHKALSSDREAKIRAMTAIANENVAKLTAWPMDLLSERGGGPVGLLMPLVAGKKDIHQLYSPKSRANEFHGADWRFLIRAAANTARAFAAVHDAGCVIGDVNHGGVLVGNDATVKLIDCDSFQVFHGGRRFLCEVGVETFTPPELQAKSFAGIVRTPHHDNFGLAVMTFLLLFMGRHPFAGVYSGPGDMPISKAIEEVRFAFGSRSQSVQMRAPPFAAPLSIVGPQVALLFERAFAREAMQQGRPSARDWVAGLAALEKEVRRCSANQAHWHHAGSPCPWCGIEASTGIQLFQVRAANQPIASGFDLAAAWRAIDGVQHPGSPPAIADGKAPDAEGTSGGFKAKQLIPWIAAAVLVVFGLNGGGGWMFLAAAAIGFWLANLLAPDKEKVKAGEERLRKARADWGTSWSDWELKAGPKTFDDKLASLRDQRRRLEAIPAKRNQRLDQLKRELRQLQLNRFLDRFEIAKSKIESIGPGRKQMLESFGIETALDVTKAALQRVPGFGPVLQSKLLAWRAVVEKRFVFDPSKGVDPRDTQKVEAEILAERRSLETEIANGAGELNRLRTEIIAARTRLRQRAELAHSNVREAAKELRELR